jgi:hypothetical protein
VEGAVGLALANGPAVVPDPGDRPQRGGICERVAVDGEDIGVEPWRSRPLRLPSVLDAVDEPRTPSGKGAPTATIRSPPFWRQ